MLFLLKPVIFPLKPVHRYGGDDGHDSKRTVVVIEVIVGSPLTPNIQRLL